MLAFISLALIGEASAPPPAPTGPVGEKKKCVDEAQTGSMMRHSVCPTCAEWADIAAARARSVLQLQDSSGAFTHKD